MQKQELHGLIDQNKDHAYFGTLLIHRDPSFIYHPSVQLNENLSLGWMPRSGEGLRDVGVIGPWIPVWNGVPRWEPAKYVQYWGRDRTLRALHASVEIFHDDWYYDFWRLNCEHWAQGVVTGKFCCYQIEKWTSSDSARIEELLGDIPGDPWSSNEYAQNQIRKAVG